jgi:hypothetical protein
MHVILRRENYGAQDVEEQRQQRRQKKQWQQQQQQQPQQKMQLIICNFFSLLSYFEKIE